MEAVRKIGFTIASILAAISSAGMRLGVWYHRPAAPKMARHQPELSTDQSDDKDFRIALGNDPC
jgi:hypothetical protein